MGQKYVGAKLLQRPGGRSGRLFPVKKAKHRGAGARHAGSQGPIVQEGPLQLLHLTAAPGGQDFLEDVVEPPGHAGKSPLSRAESTPAVSG